MQRGRSQLLKRSADAFLVAWARNLLRRASWVLRWRRPYAPVELGGRRYPNKREAEIRWEAIAALIKQYQAGSILDIGCAEGWFLRRAALEFNCFAIGIDANFGRVLLGEIARLHDATERISIMHGKLSPQDIRRLPAADIVLCLSVLHWVITESGMAEAREFVRAVATRAKKALVFEIGRAERYARRLPSGERAAASPEEFVRNLLQSADLTNIRVVASSPSASGKTRLLFAAEPLG